MCAAKLAGWTPGVSFNSYWDPFEKNKVREDTESELDDLLQSFPRVLLSHGDKINLTELPFLCEL